jgi:hypothetical protein
MRERMNSQVTIWAVIQMVLVSVMVILLSAAVAKPAISPCTQPDAMLTAQSK